MELKEIFQIIKRKILLLVIIVLLFFATTLYLTLNQEESFESSSILTVEATKETTDQYQYSGFYSIQSSDLFINTILGWIKSPNIVSEIYTKAEIDFDSKKIKSLGKKIYSKKVPPQNIILTVSESDKEKSKKITESTINIIKEKTNQMALVANSSASFEILNSQIITNSIEPNLPFNIMISLIASLILSLILIFAIEYFSPTINNNQRIKNIFNKNPLSLRGLKIKGLANPESKEAEKFRFIRANIINDEEKYISIIGGVNEQETTSLIASNMALSFARSGKKTILIDANFNNPNIHEYFDKKNEFGFSEFLFDEKNIEKYLQKTSESNLKIIPGGIKLSYASDTIERSNLEKIMEELQKEADVILINIPALNLSSESYPLFNFVKNSILIIKTGKTTLSAAIYLNRFLDKKNVDKNIIVL